MTVSFAHGDAPSGSIKCRVIYFLAEELLAFIVGAVFSKVS
jgi:hypothetical protein